MSCKDLLQQLAQKNISIGLVDGQLRLLDPEGSLNEALLQDIRSQKEELIALLKDDGNLDKHDFPLASISNEELSKILELNQEIDDIYIATPLQAGLIFHGLFDGADSGYILQTYCDLVGDIDLEAMKKAWQLVVDRHDILRTCFAGLDSENIHQLVKQQCPLHFNEEDWRDVQKDILSEKLELYRKADKAKGFDFEQAPLLRFSLIRIEDARYHFVYAGHHALVDGWCTPILFKEVFAFYHQLVANQKPSLPPVLQFKEYIRWLLKKDPTASRLFWKEYLQGFSEPTLLGLANTSSDEHFSECGNVHIQLLEHISKLLNQLATESSCTMNTLVQLAWAYLLHNYSGDEDVVFGTTVSGRPAELPGVENMLGLFINVIPCRIRFEKSLTIEQYLKALQRDNLSRDENAFVSLADIQRASEAPNGTPLFNSLFTFENYPMDKLIENSGSAVHSETAVSRPSSFSIESAAGLQWSNYPLDISVLYQNTLMLDIRYDQSVFVESTIQRLLGHLEQILVGMAEGGAGVALSSIRLLTEEEGQQLADWNQTDFDYDREAGLGALFSAQAARTPDNIALCNGSESLRYEALDRQSNRLAHYLLSLGLQADDVVGIYLPGGCELGVALLSVIKAGGRFLLLDTQYPDSRLAYMLKDSGAGYLLGTAAHPVSFDPQDLIVVEMDRIDMSSQSSEATGLVARGGDDGIGVFYTSGSTGQPKGVLYSHRNLVNYSQSMQEVLGSCAQDRVWQLASVSFDVILEELLPAWLSGGTVVVNESEGLLGAGELQESMGDLSISVLELSFAQWREWLYWLQVNNEVPPPSLRVVMVGCEAIPVRLMRQWVAYDVALVHVFGLTETAITSSTWHSKAWDEGLSGSLPSGKPMGNTRLHVLDMAQQLQPVGVAGELYIGGDGVTEGYIHQEALTESRFVDLPWIDSGRLYRTGDKVRWREDGNIEFIGRMDNQVKVRGYRIEPGEIEARLRQLPQVQDAVVLVREEEGHDKQLVAYVVAEQTGGEEDGLVSDIRTGLLRHLPGYMIPSYFLLLESLPLTLSGKVDKQALPAPGSQYLEQSGYVAPRNELESQLCAIWSSALRVERVGITDNFFELGGDSIISIQIASRASQAGINLSVRQLFEHQNIADVVANLDSHVRVDAFQGEVIGEQILLPIHHWFFAEKQVKPEHNNMSLLLVPPADVDEAFFTDVVGGDISSA